MMSQLRFSADRFSGLNSQIAPHLLPAGGLQVAENADYSETGAVKPIKASGEVVTANGEITGAGWCVIDGTSYYIYKEYDTSYKVQAYDVDAEATTELGSGLSWGSGELCVIQANDEVVLTDGTVNRIWDGTVLRKPGTPTPTYGTSVGDRVVVYDATEVSITGISLSGTTVTVETGGISVNDGDSVWIDGLTSGPTEVNGAMYVVANEDGSDFDLEGIDGSSWSFPYSGSGGAVYVGACGLTGTYRYRASTEVVLPSGQEIHGSLTSVPKYSGGASAPEESVTLTPTKAVDVYLRGFKTSDVTSWAAGTYTAGTDLLVSREMYRSKAGDTEQAYFLVEREHADVYGSDALVFEDTLTDAELGYQWLGGSPAGFDTHDAPSTFSCGAMHNYRLYVAVGNEMYWSNTDGPGYFKPTSVVSVDQDITAIESVGDFVVIFAEYGAWLWDPVNEAMKSLRVRRGVDDIHGVEKFDGRVWYANDLGLFVLDTAQLGGFSVDAVQSRPVSWPVDDAWRACDGDWSLCSTHDTLYANCKETSSSTSFVLHVGDGAKWGTFSPGEVVYHGVFSDTENNLALYFGPSGALRSIGGGSSDLTMTVKGPAHMARNGRLGILKTDCGALSSYTATVMTNRGGSTEATVSGLSGRTTRYAELEKLGGEFFEVQYSGTGTLYGYVLAVDDSRGRGF